MSALEPPLVLEDDFEYPYNRAVVVCSDERGLGISSKSARLFACITIENAPDAVPAPMGRRWWQLRQRRYKLPSRSVYLSHADVMKLNRWTERLLARDPFC